MVMLCQSWNNDMLDVICVNVWMCLDVKVKTYISCCTCCRCMQLGVQWIPTSISWTLHLVLTQAALLMETGLSFIPSW